MTTDNPAIDEKTAQQIQAERCKLVYEKVYTYMANSISLGWQTMQDIRISMNCQPVGFECGGEEVVDAINALITKGLIKVDAGSGALNQGGPFRYKFDETKPGPTVDVPVRKLGNPNPLVQRAVVSRQYRYLPEIMELCPDLTQIQVSQACVRLYKAGVFIRSKSKKKVEGNPMRATWGYKAAPKSRRSKKPDKKAYLANAGVEVQEASPLVKEINDVEFEIGLIQSRIKEDQALLTVENKVLERLQRML